MPVSNVAMIKMLTGMPNTLPVGLTWPKITVKSLNRKLCCDLKNYEDFVNKIGSFSVTVNFVDSMFVESTKINFVDCNVLFQCQKHGPPSAIVA